MDPRFQTSFIPKKPIVASQSSSSKSINLFSLLGTVIFIAALALSGGTFAYKKIISGQIVESKASLERAKGAFEPELIQELIRLDSRIESSKTLLGSHIAVTPFFDFLSSVTLRTVRFRDFSFLYLAKDKIQVVMKGQAQSYAAVALQSDLLNAQKELKDTILSEMTLEPAGTVAFNVSTTIEPKLFSYSTVVQSVQASAPAPVKAPSATTTNP